MPRTIKTPKFRNFALRRHHMAGLYIHIPFCKSKCAYCDFYSVTDLARRGELVAALGHEMQAQAGWLAGDPLKTIYFGGGTPSLCSPTELQGLIDNARSLFDCTPLGEITAEANPDDLTPEYLAALASTDVNRLSIGIQSFIDRDLRLMGRRHTASQGVEAVGAAQRAGLSNITIDLIYGIPGMSDAEWDANISQALALGVQHISAYHLTIESGTEFGHMASAGKIHAVDEAASERQYLMLHERLTAAGFEHYEISNFALSGFRAAHNSSYWSGERYLGIGPTAHSFDGRRRRWAVASLERYLAGDDIYTVEQLTERDRYNEVVMTSLRCAAGVEVNSLIERFGQRRAERLSETAERFVSQGLMARKGTRYFIPPHRFLVSDAVISDFFEI